SRGAEFLEGGPAPAGTAATSSAFKLSDDSARTHRKFGSRTLTRFQMGVDERTELNLLCPIRARCCQSRLTVASDAVFRPPQYVVKSPANASSRPPARLSSAPELTRRLIRPARPSRPQPQVP